MEQRTRDLSHDEHGAVFVEKLIVYLPVLLTFFLGWELAELAAASLMVQRASAAAGRAAVVVLPDDPVFYAGEEVGSFSGRRAEDIELAAGMVLSAHPAFSSDFEVDVSEPPETVGPIDVTVTAPYQCGPVSVICGVDSAIELSATTRHTYQGAKYAFSTPGGLGGSTGALVTTEDGYRRGKRSEGDFDNNSVREQRGAKACDTGCPLRREVELLQKEVKKRGERGEFCAKGATIAWSGGSDVMAAAQAWGSKGKGQTLEQTVGGKWLDGQKLFNKKCPNGKTNYWDPALIWDEASRYFIKCAKGGRVYKFQACDRVKGGGAKGLNTWEQVEKPILDSLGMTAQGRNFNTLQTESLCENQS